MNKKNKKNEKEEFKGLLTLPTITKGLLKNYGDFHKLFLSKELPEIYDKKSNFLIIYAIYPELTRITCYPSKSNEIWKLSISLTSPNSQVLKELNMKLNNYKIIHTTGLSKKNGFFVVELYLISLKRKVDGSDLDKLISNIKGIRNSKIKKIIK